MRPFVFVIEECRKPEDAGGIRGRGVGAKLPHHAAHQILGTIRIEVLDPPNHLILAGRAFDNVIWRGNVVTSFDRLDRGRPVSVEVQIHVPDFANVALPPPPRGFVQRIHRNIDFEFLPVLVPKPGLKRFRSDSCRARDPLFGLVASLPDQHDGELVIVAEIRPNIFAGCVSVHSTS